MMRADYEGCNEGCLKTLNITEVTSENSEIFNCCFNTCNYGRSGFIIDGEFSATGLVSSFAASVDFDTAWMYIIESSVNRCFDTMPFNIKYDCTRAGISMDFVMVFMCAFSQNFVQCPQFSGLEICKLAIMYVQECYTY